MASVTDSFCDHSLTMAERCATRVSLKQIQLNENFDSVNFWGKIMGIERDYILVDAVKLGHRVTRKYFFSSDGGLSFSQLPIVEPWMETKCMQIAQRFTGTESYVYDDPTQPKKVTDGEEEEEEEEVEQKEETAEESDGKEKEEKADDGTDEEPPLVQPELTELHRLAWTMHKITQECFIVPKGSMRLTSKKVIQNNPSFKGLDMNKTNKLDSYLHWRSPQSKPAMSIFRRVVAINSSDFLDPITDDLPNGCWRLRSLDGGMNVRIRNLLWPGYEFQYNSQQTQFTQGYFGYGVRQSDLVFLV